MAVVTTASVLSLLRPQLFAAWCCFLVGMAKSEKPLGLLLLVMITSQMKFLACIALYFINARKIFLRAKTEMCRHGKIDNTRYFWRGKISSTISFWFVIVEPKDYLPDFIWVITC